MRWIPNPVADLMFPEGTFVRAITESFTAAQSGPGRGIDAIRAVGYPGFDHAFNNGWDLDFLASLKGLTISIQTWSRMSAPTTPRLWSCARTVTSSRRGFVVTVLSQRER